jgi:alpha-ribazole phosphatase
MKLWLARHGTTDWNTDGRFQGQKDVPLNATGQDQARKLARRLAGVPIDCIFASDLNRARNSAAEVAAYHDVPVTVDSRLREICFGEWEGQFFDDIALNDADRFRAWRAHDSLQSAPPGGESLEHLAARVRSFLDDLTRQASESSVFVVTHGGTAGVMLCLLLGMPATRYWQFRLSQAALTELELKAGHVRLNYFNDTCHLLIQ